MKGTEAESEGEEERETLTLWFATQNQEVDQAKVRRQELNPHFPRARQQSKYMGQDLPGLRSGVRTQVLALKEGLWMSQGASELLYHTSTPVPSE